MCEPATLVAIAAVTGAVGTGVSAVGHYQANKTRQAMSRYNAQLAERKAADAQYRGRIEETKQRLKNRDLLGKQITGFAAKGISSSGGSALDVITNSAFMGEVDAQIIRTNAEREQEDFRNEAVNQRNQARQFGAAASSSLLTGAFNMVSEGAGGMASYKALKKKAAG